MNRYSPGHSVLQASAYFAPLLPMWLMEGIYSDRSYTPTLPDVALLWLIGLAISYAMIAIHECGHALVARLAGIEIASITIGHWRRLVALSFGKVPITVRAAPSTGYVTFKPSAALLSVSRLAFTLLAGVLAEAAFAACAVSMRSPAHISSFGALLFSFSRLAVVCTGGLHILFNLLPTTGRVAGTQHATDGMQLLNLLKNRKRLPAQRELLAQTLALDRLFSERKFAEAINLAEAIVQREAGNVALTQYLAQLYAESGNTAKAEAITRNLLTQSVGSQKLAEVLDQLCCLALYHGRTDLLKEADAWSSEALRYAPGAITLEGTRGSILIELGRVAEGTAMLHKVARHSECPIDQVISYAYLAKVAATHGDRDDAVRWLKKALAIDPRHRVVRRIEAELRPALGDHG